MIIKYINKQGNFAILETLVEKDWEQRLEKIGLVWFEKKDSLQVKKEVKVEVVATDVSDDNEEFDEVAAKEYLKSKGVRGYGLLKGVSLKKKAKEEGFITQ